MPFTTEKPSLNTINIPEGAKLDDLKSFEENGKIMVNIGNINGRAVNIEKTLLSGCDSLKNEINKRLAQALVVFMKHNSVTTIITKKDRNIEGILLGKRCIKGSGELGKLETQAIKISEFGIGNLFPQRPGPEAPENYKIWNDTFANGDPYERLKSECDDLYERFQAIKDNKDTRLSMLKVSDRKKEKRKIFKEGKENTAQDLQDFISKWQESEDLRLLGRNALQSEDGKKLLTMLKDSQELLPPEEFFEEREDGSWKMRPRSEWDKMRESNFDHNLELYRDIGSILKGEGETEYDFPQIKALVEVNSRINEMNKFAQSWLKNQTKEPLRLKLLDDPVCELIRLAHGGAPLNRDSDEDGVRAIGPGSAPIEMCDADSKIDSDDDSKA